MILELVAPCTWSSTFAPLTSLVWVASLQPKRVVHAGVELNKTTTNFVKTNAPRHFQLILLKVISCNGVIVISGAKQMECAATIVLTIVQHHPRSDLPSALTAYLLMVLHGMTVMMTPVIVRRINF